MRRFAACLLTILALCFPRVRAQAGEYAAPGREISASEFIENFTSLLDTISAPPEVSEAEVVSLEESDPETYMFINGARAHPPEPVNFGGDGRLALTRPASGERIISAYRNSNGTYNRKELARINRVMRCSLTGRATPVSIKLIELLDAIEDRFGKRGLTLLSGYRTPALNSWLPGAARRSMHMLGWAADIRVPGRNPAEVAAYARQLRGGGVGYYPDFSFTHLDSGRPRSWVVRRSPVQRSAVQPRAVPAR